MLEGFERTEPGQLFTVLTPEQQKEVRHRVLARRVAAQQKKKQSMRK